MDPSRIEKLYDRLFWQRPYEGLAPPTEETLAAYLLGRLEPAQRTRVEKYLAGSPESRAELARLEVALERFVARESSARERLLRRVTEELAPAEAEAAAPFRHHRDLVRAKGPARLGAAARRVFEEIARRAEQARLAPALAPAAGFRSDPTRSVKAVLRDSGGAALLAPGGEPLTVPFALVAARVEPDSRLYIELSTGDRRYWPSGAPEHEVLVSLRHERDIIPLPPVPLRPGGSATIVVPLSGCPPIPRIPLECLEVALHPIEPRAPRS